MVFFATLRSRGCWLRPIWRGYKQHPQPHPAYCNAIIRENNFVSKEELSPLISNLVVALFACSRCSARSNGRPTKRTTETATESVASPLHPAESATSATPSSPADPRASVPSALPVPTAAARPTATETAYRGQ